MGIRASGRGVGEKSILFINKTIIHNTVLKKKQCICGITISWWRARSGENVQKFGVGKMTTIKNKKAEIKIGSICKSI